MSMQACTAVIVAGGKGTRMQNTIPKQFLPLVDKPVLCHTIQAFRAALTQVKIILVLPETEIDFAKNILSPYLNIDSITLIAGGETRFHSVKNGLNVADENDIIFVHDGVRPLLSKDLILRCYEKAVEFGSAIPVIAVSDSIRKLTEDGHSEPVDRSRLRAVQTPQTFQGKILKTAFQQAFQESFTDEANVVSAMGINVNLVAGERQNIKITTPEDLIIAAAFLNQNQ